MNKEMMNDILLCMFLLTAVLVIIDLVRVVTGDYPLALLPINILCSWLNYSIWQNHKKENNL